MKLLEIKIKAQLFC